MERGKLQNNQYEEQGPRMFTILWRACRIWWLRLENRRLKARIRKINARRLAEHKEPIRLTDEELERIDALRAEAGAEPFNVQQLEG